MRKDMILVVLILSGSALLWWPGLIAKLFSFQWFLPWWFQLVIFALGIGLATILSRGRWPRFLVASTVGTFAGVLSAVVIMPDSPPDYDGIAVLIAPLASALLSLVVGLAVRKISVPDGTPRRIIWLAFASCLAFEPMALALTALFVHR